jgi:hypothetical protein
MPQRRYNEQLIKQWEASVYKKADDIDPNKEYSWEALSYGYFLALTNDPKRAQGLAHEVYMKGLTR